MDNSMEPEKKSDQSTSGINYYVITAIVLSILVFEITNYYEPQVDNELDFFEVARLLGFASVAILSFSVAKKFWVSKSVFRKAYLSLGIAYTFYTLGDILWYVFQVGYDITNPYPYYPDIGYFLFYPFVIWHLRTNVHYFKRNLEYRQKTLLIIIPLVVAAWFIVFELIPMDVSHGVSHLKILPMEEHGQQFYNGFFMGLVDVTATSLALSYALIGAQVFRKGILGYAWGLILIGIALNTAADIHYYYFSIFSFDRQNPVHGIWLASTMIISYALYLHRKI